MTDNRLVTVVLMLSLFFAQPVVGMQKVKNGARRIITTTACVGAAVGVVYVAYQYGIPESLRLFWRTVNPYYSEIAENVTVVNNNVVGVRGVVDAIAPQAAMIPAIAEGVEALPDVINRARDNVVAQLAPAVQVAAAAAVVGATASHQAVGIGYTNLATSAVNNQLLQGIVKGGDQRFNNIDNVLYGLGQGISATQSEAAAAREFAQQAFNGVQSLQTQMPGEVRNIAGEVAGNAVQPLIKLVSNGISLLQSNIKILGKILVIINHNKKRTEQFIQNAHEQQSRYAAANMFSHLRTQYMLSQLSARR